MSCSASSLFHCCSKSSNASDTLSGDFVLANVFNFFIRNTLLKKNPYTSASSSELNHLSISTAVKQSYLVSSRDSGVVLTLRASEVRFCDEPCVCGGGRGVTVVGVLEEERKFVFSPQGFPADQA